MIRVLLEAPILTNSGYGEHSRLVYQSLLKRHDLDVYINCLNWGNCSWDIPNDNILKDINKYRAYQAHCEQTNQQEQYSLQIRVGIPNEFEKKADYSVCVTAGIETDRVSANWLLKTHQGIDKLIVPSEHAKLGFLNTGYEIVNKTKNTKTELTCNCPVDVIPYPVKHLEHKDLEIDFKTNFNFLQIAMMGPRKNIELSIKCFIEEFRDNPDVGLVIKTSLSRSSKMDRIDTKSLLHNLIDSHGEKKCKIYLIHGNMTDEEVHSLYTHPKIKAYYTTTHGEGYGLPIFEAAYSGLPVIATDWSGHLDFLSGEHKGKNKKLFAKIAYELKQVQDKAVWGDLIIKESKWAFAKEVSVKNQLSKVYKNHGMYKTWAKSLQQKIVETYKLDNILDKYNKSIFGEKTEEEVEWEQELSKIEIL
tara:strand:- start:464 stop:1717 length:1254 start_codon:yes stop_codon:yes gene_type:complete